MAGGSHSHRYLFIGARFRRPSLDAMKILEHITLKDKTTMRVGGPARYFVSVTSESELREVVQFAHDKKIPFFVLGSGSNIIISDDGFEGLVIQMNIVGISYSDARVTAGAGENWDAFVADTLAHNLYGLENLSLIPGTVGAAPIQNIGAYGREVSEFIETVDAFNTETMEVEALSNYACSFGYRMSRFKTDAGKKYIVTHVTFRLFSESCVDASYKDLQAHFGGVVPTPEEVRKAVIDIRTKKLPDPAEVGTVGSFFKNPIIKIEHYKKLQEKYSDLPSFVVDDLHVKIPLAWILDHILNLKGFQQGGVKLHATQPLALINIGDASASDIELFAEDVAARVFEKTNIHIEWEVQKIKNKK